MFHFTLHVIMDWHFECVCRNHFGRMRKDGMDYKAMEKVVEFAKSRRNRRGMWKYVWDYNETYFTDLIHMLEQKAFRRRHPNFDRTFKRFFIKRRTPIPTRRRYGVYGGRPSRLYWPRWSYDYYVTCKYIETIQQYGDGLLLEM